DVARAAVAVEESRVRCDPAGREEDDHGATGLGARGGWRSADRDHRCLPAVGHRASADFRWAGARLRLAGTWGIAGSVVTALRRLLNGTLSVRSLSGPVEIGHASYVAAQA